MLIEHRGKTTQVDPSVCVAHTAAVRAAARIGADERILLSGHSYAWELTGSPGIRDSGSPVRAGSVRCSDRSDADGLPEAVADLDGNRESRGDLPG